MDAEEAEDVRVLRRDSWSLRASVVVLFVALGGPLGSAAGADRLAPLYAKMKQRFTVNHPGRLTGWTFDGALKPIASGVQVPPQRDVDFVFPEGTRLDAGAVRQCRASDQQITRVGPSACPASSRIGSGSAGLALGTTGRLDTKLIVFDGRRRLILVFMTTSGSVVRVLSGTISGTRIRAHIPRTVLPSGGEIAVFRFALQLRAAGSAKRPLIRTPRTCPRNGRWTFTYLPRYDPPYGVQRSTSSMRCSRR